MTNTNAMQNKPLISVVLCTYNNADSLALTLQQLSAQQVDHPEHFEILLIDNNSPDNTANIGEAFVNECPLQARYIFEGRQGLSHARNTGLDNAIGEYILFTDDDAELPSNWLNTYANYIYAHQPDCLYSKIQVIWDQEKPWWYLPEYRPCFVELNYGDVLLNVTDIHHEFFGKNFCVKKELILAQGGFDPTLGRIGTKLIAGEETLLYRGLINKACKVIYFPDAVVGHRLKPKEYSEEHIKKLFIDGAYSALRICNVTATKKIFNRPLRALIDYAITFIKSTLLATYYGATHQKAKSHFHYLNILKSITFMKLWILSK